MHLHYHQTLYVIPLPIRRFFRRGWRDQASTLQISYLVEQVKQEWRTIVDITIVLLPNRMSSHLHV